MEKPALIEDPVHWRQRAEEARRAADQIDDPTAKKTMREISAAYERFVAILESKPKS